MNPKSPQLEEKSGEITLELIAKAWKAVEARKNEPKTPQIVLKGWWWKRWFSGFRKQRDAMQALLDWADEEYKITEQVNQRMINALMYGDPDIKYEWKRETRKAKI